jgi:hypothetical protein
MEKLTPAWKGLTPGRGELQKCAENRDAVHRLEACATGKVEEGGVKPPQRRLELVLALGKDIGIEIAVLVPQEIEPGCFVCGGKFGGVGKFFDWRRYRHFGQQL